jgi:hypothetical protein
VAGIDCGRKVTNNSNLINRRGFAALLPSFRHTVIALLPVNHANDTRLPLRVKKKLVEVPNVFLANPTSGR